MNPLARTSERFRLELTLVLIHRNMHYMVNGAEETSSQPFDFDKPTLAFIHAGLSSSQRSFRFQMLDPRLTGAYNLLFLDSRFHGLTSGEERETHTLEVRCDRFAMRIEGS